MENWKYDELLVLYRSLDKSFQAHGGDIAKFTQALGKFTIYNLPSWNGGMAPPNPNAVILGDNTFTFGGDSDFLILHELGHRFDFNGSGGDSGKYKSGTFVNVFSPGCKSGTLGCLGTNPHGIYQALDTLSGGGGPGSYKPTDLKTSPYALKNGSIDDFADSYAYYIHSSLGLSSPVSVSDSRKMIIATWVDLTK